MRFEGQSRFYRKTIRKILPDHLVLSLEIMKVAFEMMYLNAKVDMPSIFHSLSG